MGLSNIGFGGSLLNAIDPADLGADPNQAYRSQFASAKFVFFFGQSTPK
jgi:hypothetical protein